MPPKKANVTSDESNVARQADGLSDSTTTTTDESSSTTTKKSSLRKSLTTPTTTTTTTTSKVSKTLRALPIDSIDSDENMANKKQPLNDQYATHNITNITHIKSLRPGTSPQYFTPSHTQVTTAQSLIDIVGLLTTKSNTNLNYQTPYQHAKKQTLREKQKQKRKSFNYEYGLYINTTPPSKKKIKPPTLDTIVQRLSNDGKLQLIRLMSRITNSRFAKKNSSSNGSKDDKINAKDQKDKKDADDNNNNNNNNNNNDDYTPAPTTAILTAEQLVSLSLQHSGVERATAILDAFGPTTLLDQDAAQLLQFNSSDVAHLSPYLNKIATDAELNTALPPAQMFAFASLINLAMVGSDNLNTYDTFMETNTIQEGMTDLLMDLSEKKKVQSELDSFTVQDLAELKECGIDLLGGLEAAGEYDPVTKKFIFTDPMSFNDFISQGSTICDSSLNMSLTDENSVPVGLSTTSVALTNPAVIKSKTTTHKSTVDLQMITGIETKKGRGSTPSTSSDESSTVKLPKINIPKGLYESDSFKKVYPHNLLYANPYDDTTSNHLSKLVRWTNSRHYFHHTLEAFEKRLCRPLDNDELYKLTHTFCHDDAISTPEYQTLENLTLIPDLRQLVISDYDLVKTEALSLEQLGIRSFFQASAADAAFSEAWFPSELSVVAILYGYLTAQLESDISIKQASFLVQFVEFFLYIFDSLFDSHILYPEEIPHYINYKAYWYRMLYERFVSIGVPLEYKPHDWLSPSTKQFIDFLENEQHQAHFYHHRPTTSSSLPTSTTSASPSASQVADDKSPVEGTDVVTEDDNKEGIDQETITTTSTTTDHKRQKTNTVPQSTNDKKNPTVQLTPAHHSTIYSSEDRQLLRDFRFIRPNDPVPIRLDQQPDLVAMDSSGAMVSITGKLTQVESVGDHQVKDYKNFPSTAFPHITTAQGEPVMVDLREFSSTNSVSSKQALENLYHTKTRGNPRDLKRINDALSMIKLAQGHHVGAFRSKSTIAKRVIRKFRDYKRSLTKKVLVGGLIKTHVTLPETNKTDATLATSTTTPPTDTTPSSTSPTEETNQIDTDNSSTTPTSSKAIRAKGKTSVEEDTDRQMGLWGPFSSKLPQVIQPTGVQQGSHPFEYPSTPLEALNDPGLWDTYQCLPELGNIDKLIGFGQAIDNRFKNLLKGLDEHGQKNRECQPLNVNVVAPTASMGNMNIRKGSSNNGEGIDVDTDDSVNANHIEYTPDMTINEFPMNKESILSELELDSVVFRPSEHYGYIYLLRLCYSLPNFSLSTILPKEWSQYFVYTLSDLNQWLLQQTNLQVASRKARETQMFKIRSILLNQQLQFSKFGQPLPQPPNLDQGEETAKAVESPLGDSTTTTGSNPATTTTTIPNGAITPARKNPFETRLPFDGDNKFIYEAAGNTVMLVTPESIKRDYESASKLQHLHMNNKLASIRAYVDELRMAKHLGIALKAQDDLAQMFGLTTLTDNSCLTYKPDELERQNGQPEVIFSTSTVHSNGNFGDRHYSGNPTQGVFLAAGHDNVDFLRIKERASTGDERFFEGTNQHMYLPHHQQK